LRTLLISEKDVEWLPLKNCVEFYRDTSLPKRDLITSVHVFAFLDDQILFIKHPDRDWDIPGGHIEKNETPEKALEREVYEETCVRLKDIRIFGYFKIILFESYPTIVRYPYPESYILLYIGCVGSLDPFVPEYEIQERKLFPPAAAKKLSWIKRYRELYDAAFKENMNIDKK
jgi:8-oxo-dGTP diphosphatase